MKPKLLLRIASGAMLFHLLGHTFGHSTWKLATDPVKQAVISQMTEHKFPFMGSIRSMTEYYDGYGWATSIGLIFFALILWLISSAIKESPRLALRLLISTSICLFAWSIDEFIFFFPFAACTTLLSAILTLVAIFQIRKQKM
jgi:hypothetical protein